MSNASVAELLEQQLVNLNQLLQLLQQETDYLAKRDVDNIETLLKNKLALLDNIQAMDAAIGQHPDVSLLKQQPELVKRTDEAQALLTQCQQLNAHNQEQAELVSASLGRLQQLLQRNRQTTTMTYTDEGKTHVGQRLGKSIKA